VTTLHPSQQLYAYTTHTRAGARHVGRSRRCRPMIANRSPPSRVTHLLRLMPALQSQVTKEIALSSDVACHHSSLPRDAWRMAKDRSYNSSRGQGGVRIVRILADGSRQEWSGVVPIHCRSSTDAELWAIALAPRAESRKSPVRIVTDNAAAIGYVCLLDADQTTARYPCGEDFPLDPHESAKELSDIASGREATAAQETEGYKTDVLMSTHTSLLQQPDEDDGITSSYYHVRGANQS
jgi:hypothetical protein